MAPSVVLAFDQSCLAGGAQFDLELSDADGAKLSMTSSNRTLVPHSRFAVSRTGDRVTLSVQPRPWLAGVAHVGVRVTTTGGTAEASVRVEVATDERDVLVGEAGPDILIARGGDVIFRGQDGMDLLCGGGGDDRLLGGPGHDSLYGQSGDDDLSRARSGDKVVGGSGRDLSPVESSDEVGPSTVWPITRLGVGARGH